jgi:hypothetical protein
MSRVAERQRARAGEQVDLRVEVPGELVLPREVLDRLRLDPGDRIAFEPGPHSIRLDLYLEVLGSLGNPALARGGAAEDRDREPARRLVEEFLSQPSTALLTGGRLPIPHEVLPLAGGDRCVLQIVPRGLVHEIFLFKVGADA